MTTLGKELHQHLTAFDRYGEAESLAEFVLRNANEILEAVGYEKDERHVYIAGRFGLCAVCAMTANDPAFHILEEEAKPSKYGHGRNPPENSEG